MQIHEISLREQQPIGAVQPAVAPGNTTKTLASTEKPDLSGIPDRPSEEHVVSTAMAAMRADQHNQHIPDAALKAMIGSSGAGAITITRAMLEKMAGRSAPVVADYLARRMGVQVR